MIAWVDFSCMQKEIKDEIYNKFDLMYKKQMYIQGNEYKAFNEEFAKYCGTKYAIGVGNGLDALMLILRACNIGKGDEVIV